MSSVQLRGLTRRFPGASRAAVEALDLEVGAGEIVSLVGPSGCGKSTTLRLIAGLDRPDGGDVLIDGKSMQGVPPQERDVAMVFQGFALYPHLRVREILAFPLRMRRTPPAEQKRIVGETAELLGLTPLLDRRPGELSGGEQQRVAMGRAIVRRPRVFLFDEPLSNLDAALRNELRVELGRLLRELGTTALYVTHDQVEAMTLSNRIALLRAGRLEQLATPRAIYEEPASTFVASFFGSPPMNLLRATRDGELLRAGPLALSPAELGVGPDVASVTLGIRPEHLGLMDGNEGLPPGARAVELPLVSLEPLGAETHLTVKWDAHAVRLRAPGFVDIAPGKTVTVVVRPERVRIFDGESGRAL